MDFPLNDILVWLTPFIVWAVTALVVRFKPLIPGWLVVSVVVPLLSVVITFVTGLIVPTQKPILQFVLGFLAVFLSQLRIQLSAEKRAEDKKGDGK